MASILDNAAALVPQMESLLRAICYLIGMVLVATALARAARRSELGAQSGSWAAPISGFVAGIAFLAFPQAVSVGLQTLFGAGAPADPAAIFAYGDIPFGSREAPAATRMLEAIFLIARLLGYIAFARGIYLLNAAAASSGAARTAGPGITFLVAGVGAVNFPGLVRLLQ